ERERVLARDSDHGVPADVEHEEGNSRVEQSRRPGLPRLDLVACDVAPEEVRDDAEHDEEREADERPRGGKCGLLVQDDDCDGDERENREVAQEWVHVSHAVMYARTPSAAATSIATANHSRRARGSVGA